MWDRRITIGATYFHNDLSNLIGFNGLFETLNLGAAETQGVELEIHARPIAELLLTATYTYLEAEKTDNSDISQLQGARLPRRPRNEVYASASYLWFKKLRTTVEAKWVDAREELEFWCAEFRYRGLQLREFRSRVCSDCKRHHFRPHRQFNE